MYCRVKTLVVGENVRYIQLQPSGRKSGILSSPED